VRVRYGGGDDVDGVEERSEDGLGFQILTSSSSIILALIVLLTCSNCTTLSLSLSHRTLAR